MDRPDRDPRDRQLASYDFDLPSDAIAQLPVEPRHDARMLMVSAQGDPSPCRHGRIWDLLNQLKAGDVLVVNDTRVLRARLEAVRSSGGKVELLVLEPRGEARWLCLARPAKRIRPGDVLHLQAPAEPSLSLEVLAVDGETGAREIQFPPGCVDAASIEPLLVRYGQVPLPPYIHRSDAADAERYQTRFASRPGAVAAPTAGLHLSDALLEALSSKGIQLATVTLHVGLGTFRPIDTEDLDQLRLHSEWVEVSAETVEALNACRARGGRVIAVGTTSVRALEGAAQLGGRELQPMAGPVNLLIRPGFHFRVVEGLLTNFHLPRSSLLLLVSALIGRERLLSLYQEAIRNHYRFFSYGDAMWIPPEALIAGRHCPDLDNEIPSPQ